MHGTSFTRKVDLFSPAPSPPLPPPPPPPLPVPLNLNVKQLTHLTPVSPLTHNVHSPPKPTVHPTIHLACVGG